MKILEIRCLERHSSTKHRKQEDTKGPDVYEEALITFIDDDFWGQIGRSTALLLDHLAFLYDFRHTEITDFNSFLTIKKDIVELDISMNNRPAMNMCKTISYLLEDEFGVRLLQLALSLDQSQKITPSGVLHNHEQMLARFKHLQQPDDIRVLDFLKKINLLKHFSFAKIVLHIVLLDGLDGHLLTC